MPHGRILIEFNKVDVKFMKISTSFTIAVLVCSFALPSLWSQTTTVSSEPIAGVVQEVIPEERIVLNVGNEAQSRTFRLRKTTQFLDAQGNVVTLDKVQQGGPVSVQYVRDGNDLVVEKVIVTPATAVSQPATTTTTTVATTAPKVESIEGIITEFVPASASLTIGSPKSSVPMKYQLTEETEFVDLEGNPVDRAAMELGRPVTVHYVVAGSDLVASRVVVGKAARLVPAETTTTTTTEVVPAN